MAAGFIAGAFLAQLSLQLGFPDLIGWGMSLPAVAIFAAVGALASIFARFLWVVSIVDIVLFLFVCLIGLTPVISPFAMALLRADSLPRDGVDAIVVLSSTVTSSGTLNVTGSDRLLAGLELMRAGVAPKLLTTRVTRTRHGGTTSDADQRRLIDLAAMTDRWILVEGPVYSTHDEVLKSHSKLRELGAHRIAVVTSPLHTRRACAAFEQDGLLVTCRAARERREQTLLPHSAADRLAAFRTYMYERLAWIVYRSRGWVKG